MTNRRWFRIAGLIALLLVLAYPIGINLFLALGGVQKMFEGTDSVKVDFRRAWSFWPGRVHVEDIRVTMQDRNVEFVLTMPTVDVTIRLRELVERRFHATRLRGSGLAFRFRHRIEPEAAGLPFVQALPPIPEFDDPPLRESGPPEAPLDEAHYNLWTIHIDDVDVGLRELWTQMFRYEGVARVVGAFRLRPAKRLWVGPAELHFEHGTIVTGPASVASEIEGTLTCKVDDFDVEPVRGMEPFRFISARASLAISVSSLDAIDFLAGPTPSFRVVDGSGALDVGVAIDHGVFTEDSRVAYRTDKVGIGVGGFELGLDGELGIAARGPRPQHGAELGLDIPNATLRFDGSHFAPIELHEVEGSLATTAVDVFRPWAMDGAAAELAAELPDLRSLQDLPIPHGAFRIDAGRGEAHGQATLSSDQILNGSMGIHLDHSKGMVAGTTLATTVDAYATVRGQGFRELHVDGRVAARETRACLASGICVGTPTLHGTGEIASSSARGLDGRFGLDAERVDADFGATRVSARSLSSRGKVLRRRIDANVELERVSAGAIGACPFIEAKSATLKGDVDTSSGAPAASLDGALQGTSFDWGRFHAASANTRVSGSWADQELAANVNATGLHLESAGGPPKGWQARLGSASIRTRLRISDAGLRGPARVEVAGLDARVGQTNVQGEVAATLDLKSQDKTYRAADVSGVVQARRVALRAGSREVSDWWAELGLRAMHVDVRQNFDFAGSIDAHFRDALPALYILASESEIPKWLPSLLPLRSLKVDLGVERFCHWTDVLLGEASGGPLKARGRVQIEPGETRGAILFQSAAISPISLGLDFVEDSSHTSVFAGRSWLEKHLEPLTKAATDKHDERCKPEPTTCE